MKSFSELFSFMFDPRVPLLFLFGWLVIAVAGNAMYSLLVSLFGGTSMVLLFAILTISLVTLVLVVVGLKYVGRTRTRSSTLDGSEAFRIPRKAIIFTVGAQKDTPLMALEHQNPRYVGFLCSTRSEPVVDDIVRTLALQSDTWYKRVINPWDIKSIYDGAASLVAALLSMEGVTNKNIVVDVTGGSTTMSVGAFMASERANLDSQYIRSEYDQYNKPILNTESAILITRHEE
ncbi:MAG: hypothetical protein M1587_06665 [Thaumarchaeota archaeon]|nr:hypothetical protein [Nitrososphaerota archaeon]